MKNEMCYVLEVPPNVRFLAPTLCELHRHFEAWKEATDSPILKSANYRLTLWVDDLDPDPPEIESFFCKICLKKVAATLFKIDDPLMPWLPGMHFTYRCPDCHSLFHNCRSPALVVEIGNPSAIWAAEMREKMKESEEDEKNNGGLPDE